ncbi:hypothetical protein GWK47_014835 [Chionoecetes opilio]|uniref:Uncharacterized protein n=1 Tax=Chionoecetes opilio TaxID=41210 RepID=A0A8J4XZU8_CHIOP|nr:hypothetical protein GWK47_014835 [Chionoecetes opilio]
MYRDGLRSAALQFQMAEQSSHINKLMEENRRYIRENGKLKKKSVSRSGATRLSPSNFDHFSSGVSDGGLRSVDGDYGQTDEMLTELQDSIMALQIHNDELNVCLEQEKRRRREAEARVERDEGYIKRLEDNVQTLRGTRVVMDSGAYRQLAEAYIASHRPPARRPQSHTHPGSDLVCDSSSNTGLGLPSLPFQTSSCPSSPKSDSSIPSSTSSSHSVYPEDSQLFPITPRRSGSVRSSKERSTAERGSRPLGGATMSPWDYQQLLENLEDLDGANRGALS